MTQEVMTSYYAQLADSYDDIELMPEREEDLEEVAEQVAIALANHTVLELGCGTGFWTEIIAQSATSVLATDINEVMIARAQKKFDSDAKVQFDIADWTDFSRPAEEKYTACFAGFMWSHVKREEYKTVLENIRKTMGAGSLLVLVDDNEMEEGGLPIARTDAEGNTFQPREQKDGTRVQILKNYPTDSFLRKRFALVARDIRVSRNEFFWMLTCVLK
ncbi:MAG: class I SAM-dependent methyltransferase [Undibacterium sp.]|nr:class I SAM-dependent methyltransferase [Undibacterium sp.]